ncbi:hypothetical protein [Vagococcus luciliae]|uniref:Uncharacterized protein n=1 Tax=Vagococcus luciliae TaxID=2920380 RepID=A0ABY5NY37_9ENTE|nr:hypothetical protein [Vagococcus luciliae]UUV98346.1 hypothetical protein G314FT_04620 [Vagococcus luciliae]
MQPKPTLWKNIPLTFLIAILQTTISLIPGILFLKNSSHGALILNYMIFYLLLSDFFQLVGKNTYKKGKSIPLVIYGVKLIISTILIYLIIKQTAIQFGIILLAYELFQMMIFSKQFYYVDSLFYSFTNAFFKGIVFNQLLTISYPFDYDFELIKPFVFSFLIVLFLTIFTQGMYSYLSRQPIFLLLGLLSLIGTYYLVVQHYMSQQLDTWKLISFIVATIISFFLFMKTKKAKKKEFILNLFALASLIIYYIQ